MRLYRNAVILLVVVGLLVGAYFVVKNKKSKDSSNSSSTNTIKVVELDSSKLSEIDVENKDGKFVFSKKDKDWTLVSGGNFKADSSKVDSIATDMASLTADKAIEDNATDLSQYGLSSPKGVVTAKASDGTVKAIEVGDKTSTKDGYYIKEKDKNKVYTINIDSGDTLLSSKNDLKDKTLFAVKSDDIIGVGMDRSGSNVFTAGKDKDGNWELTAPIEAQADASKVGTIVDAVTKVVTVRSFVEDNSSDLQKYGLKKPAYALEFKTSGIDKKILLGDEEQKGVSMYAKLADSNEVFTVDESSLNFLDMPLKEAMDAFAYIANIDDVNKIVVDMDGQATTCELATNKDDRDKDKFTVNGKDASMKNDKGDQVFRAFYQALIGITMSDLDIGAKPSGKPEITFTFYLKKAPGTMKVEFVPRDANTYYVIKNGKYSNIIVDKKKFDEPDGVRDTFKKLMDAINKK